MSANKMGDMAPSGVDRRVMKATSLVDGWIVMDTPQDNVVQNIALDLQVLLVRGEGRERDGYLWWPQLLSVAVVVFLSLLCLRLFYEMCVRCLDRREHRKRERLLSVECGSEVSVSRPISRDASAPSHRTSIPREILLPSSCLDFADHENKWQAPEQSTVVALGDRYLSHLEGADPNQDRYLEHLEGADPNHDRYLAHLEGADSIQDRYLAHLEGTDPKDWDLGQGEFKEKMSN